MLFIEAHFTFVAFLMTLAHCTLEHAKKQNRFCIFINHISTDNRKSQIKLANLCNDYFVIISSNAKYLQICFHMSAEQYHNHTLFTEAKVM